MRLEITCHDRVGMGQKVLGIFVEHSINVRGIELKQPGRIFINIPDLEFSDLQTFMPQLRLIEGVGDVRTAPFMPSERERNELVTLIKTFPDPFISIDAKGNIRIVNNIAATIMGSDEASIKGQHVSQWLKGFNFTRWLESEDVLAQTRRLKFQGEDFVADIMPINVAGESNTNGDTNKQILAGAVLILKL